MTAGDVSAGGATADAVRADGKALLLFDGDCGVCTWIAQWLERMDRGRRFAIKPHQALSDAQLAAHGTSRDACNRAVRVVTPKGRVLGGSFAINYFFWWRFPWCVAVALIYLLPPILLAEVLVYAWVARNRHRVSRWLGLTECKVKLPGPT